MLMSLFRKMIDGLLSNSSAQQRPRKTNELPKTIRPGEYIIYEQEQSGETWHGVHLSELSRFVQENRLGKCVTVDEYGFLEFHYTSRSGKTRLHARCRLDENKQLTRLPHTYYHGQWTDSADTFVELVNEKFTFR